MIKVPVTGLVDRIAYEPVRNALRTGRPDEFENLSLSGMRKFVNPQAGLAFNVEGADSHALAMPPAPAFASDEIAAEIVENYWMALLRDVHFDDYANSGDAMAAAAELTSFGSDFKGLKTPVGGVDAVTPATLFRGLTPGDNAGPYISQFLMVPVPFGAQGFDQRMLTAKAGVDFGTSWQSFIEIQNGIDAGFRLAGNGNVGDFEQEPVYIRNGRDLGQYVHIDVLFQAYFNAALVLLQGPEAHSAQNAGRTAADVLLGQMFKKDPGNPYAASVTQIGFGTFGDPYIAATLCEVAARALQAVWYQKWFVHRRLRPEAYAARIHTSRVGSTQFDLSPKAVNATVLDRVKTHNEARNGGLESYLLPLAFPEGSPMHPAYGAGHATVAGACVTVLKAFFDENQPISDVFEPVCVSSDGLSLKPYTGADAMQLTVGGELNKLASNIALGRNIAGVHWRSDGTDSLQLGEQVAIALLRDHRQLVNERFAGYELTTFGGQKVVI